MGLFDFFNSGDTTGQYLGNMIDPTTADQFVKARAQDGLLGLSIGLLNGSGPSRLPVPFTSALGAGLAGLQSAQNGLTPQALQAAQTANQVADARLKQVQGASAAYQFANLPAYQKAVMAWLQSGAQGAPPVQPSNGTGQAPARLDSSFPAVSSTTADPLLPTEARALLDTISGPESHGAYNIRYTPDGGATFDSYAQHPGIYEPGPQGKSSAAGRYQIVKSTFDPLAKQLGLSDFSPVSQDQAAWGLATKTYASNTGRDLLTDLQNGDTSRVADALGSQWATLRHSIGSYGANLAKYNLNLNAPGQAQAGNAAPPQGGNAPQAGGAPGFSPSDLPYGLTPNRILSAQGIAAFAPLAGQQPPDFIKGTADLPNQIGKAVGEQNARQGAEAAYAFPKAYGTAAGTQAANPDLVDVIINDREMKLPKADYLRMIQGQQRPTGLLPMTGQPMPSPQGAPMPPMPPQGGAGSSMPPQGLLAPGGALGAPQAPPTPPQAPQGLLAPGGPISAPVAPQMPPQNFGPVPAPGQSLMNMIGGRPTLAPPGLRPSSPGGVPIGSPGAGPVITPAMAAQMNAASPGGGHLPVMPSNYIFGRGMAPPPGAGSVSPQMPAQGPQGMPAPPQGPMASPAPTPSLTPQMGNPVAQAPIGMPAFGKPVINPLYQKGIEGVMSRDNERLAKVLQPAADTGTQMIESASLIQDLLPKVATGYGADTIQQMARVVAKMGGDPAAIERYLTDPVAGDVVQKKFLEQSSAAVRVLGAREPGSVIQLFGKAYPNLQTQKNAIQLMENVFTMQARWAQDRLAGAQQFMTGQVNGLRNNQPYTSVTEFENQFNNGPNNAQHYLKAAEAMSGLSTAWQGLDANAQKAVWALIPPGTTVIGPNGKPVTK